jgi:hypothetical protein
MIHISGRIDYVILLMKLLRSDSIDNYNEKIFHLKVQ